MSLTDDYRARLAACGLKVKEQSRSKPMSEQTVTQLQSIVMNDGLEKHGQGPSEATRNHAMALIENKTAELEPEPAETSA